MALSLAGFVYTMISMKKGLKKYFVPHPENDLRPHLWRRKSLVLLGAIVLAAEGILFGMHGAPSAGLTWEKSFLSADVLPSVLVSLTNSTRQEEHLPALSVNPRLTEAAAMKAEDMALKGYFSHVSPEGRSPWYWLDTAGYDYLRAGENLAVDFVDTKDVVDAWMQSPSHRANILKQSYTEIGTATATGIYNGRSAVFAVEFFGTPYSPSTAMATPALGIARGATLGGNTNASGIGKTADGALSAGGVPSGEVAGAEVTKVSAEDAFVPVPAAEAAPAASAGIVTLAAGSPRHAAMYLLSGLLALLFVGLGILAVSEGGVQKHKRLFWIGMIAVILVAGVMAFNAYFFKRAVVLPADGLSVIQTFASETQ